MVRLYYMSSHHKCRGCGGRITPKDNVVEVGKGRLFDVDEEEDFPGFERGGVWGYMHEHCFLVAVGDPSAIFAIEPAAA